MLSKIRNYILFASGHKTLNQNEITFLLHLSWPRDESGSLDSQGLRAIFGTHCGSAKRWRSMNGIEKNVSRRRWQLKYRYNSYESKENKWYDDKSIFRRTYRIAAHTCKKQVKKLESSDALTDGRRWNKQVWTMITVWTQPWWMNNSTLITDK